ncbi:hypothetical protein BDR07DRAFT_1610556 [Suillus spraguei]|nr:hypothetical protein BDR07DRAFT_1610556 [Suillus spraguei]
MNTSIIHHQRSLVQTHPSNMTVVSNDPSWWPLLSFDLLCSYWAVAAGVVVVYDWVLTLGQEIELIWRQRWSLMTVLYLITRYIGIPFSVITVLRDIIYYTVNGTSVVVAAMLGVITIARLHAMYKRSRIILRFLIIVFLTINIACGAMMAIGAKNTIGEELILSGTYMCDYVQEDYIQFLVPTTWALNTIWEVLALCLSVWIAVKHFRDLRRLGPSTGSIVIGDCFRVLIKSHVLYFASFAGVSSLQFVNASLESWTSTSIAAQILGGILQIFSGIQMFVLGPRLILSVREYHAKLVANSDAETSIRSIVFQERVHVSTSSTV